MRACMSHQLQYMIVYGLRLHHNKAQKNESTPLCKFKFGDVWVSGHNAILAGLSSEPEGAERSCMMVEM